MNFETVEKTTSYEKKNPHFQMLTPQELLRTFEGLGVMYRLMFGEDLIGGPDRTSSGECLGTLPGSSSPGAVSGFSSSS